MSDGSIIALILRDHTVEWTASQHRKGRAEITQQKTVELEWPAGLENRRSAEAAAYVKTRLPPLKGSVGIAIPADRVLMRVIELPSVDRDELLGMAELQVDKFSPFPMDQMALAIEVLHQSAEASRVLIAAVQNEYIDQLGDFLVNAGLYPQSVDVDVLGWWTLIRDEGHLAGEGQEALIVMDGPCAQLMVVRDGIPVLIRALDTQVQLDHPSFAREAIEEIEYTLMTLEASWGSVATGRLAIWTRNPVPAEIVETIAAEFKIEVTTHALDQLPPLSEGLSRRLGKPESAALNLAPATWRRGILSRQLQRQALQISAAAFAGWLVLMGAVWLWSNQQKSQLANAQTEMNRLQNEVAEVRELRGQVEWLQQYADRTHSSLECLREISELLPQGVEITSFIYAKGGQLNLRGECDNDGPVNDFISRLERSALFKSVKTEGISTTARGGQSRSQFRVTLMLPLVEGEGGA